MQSLPTLTDAQNANYNGGDETDTLLKDPARPFLEHVVELRRCVVWSLVFLVLATGLSYHYADRIFEILVTPLEYLFQKKAESRRFIYTNLTEAFVTYLKVALFSGLFVTLPFIFLQAWRFISPGLFKNEKQLFRLLLVAIPFFFLIGALFAYYIVLPAAFSFFLSFESAIGSIPLQLEAKMSEYLSLVMRLLLAFGLSFQLPVVLASLTYVGLLKSEQLIKKWRFAVLGVTILSAIITPPDAFSMILLAVPLLFLYTLSIILAYLIEKRK